MAICLSSKLKFIANTCCVQLYAHAFLCTSRYAPDDISVLTASVSSDGSGESVHTHMGLDARKPVFRGFANNTGADQPAHTHSLISAFGIRLLESSISRLAMGGISIF